MPIPSVQVDSPEDRFPLDSVTLKFIETGGYVKAEVLELTRKDAGLYIDSAWRKFQGPFQIPCPELPDSHWRWGSFVRRLRKNPLARCAALRTPDGSYQGAIIYRRDGASLLEPHVGAVHAEYLATAPHNRPGYAARPLYRGVGEGLMCLAMVHSYDWGLGGRVTLFSLPQAMNFYQKMNFVETSARQGRMIGYESTPEVAINLLKDKGLI
jgi:hypothetical protein